MTVVTHFATFYRNLSWISLREELQSLFGTVLELPIMRGLGSAGGAEAENEVRALEPLLQHVALGLNKIDVRQQKQVREEREGKQDQ
jgi:hypothetical protein